MNNINNILAKQDINIYMAFSNDSLLKLKNIDVYELDTEKCLNLIDNIKNIYNVVFQFNTTLDYYINTHNVGGFTEGMNILNYSKIWINKKDYYNNQILKMIFGQDQTLITIDKQILDLQVKYTILDIKFYLVLLNKYLLSIIEYEYNE